MEAISRNPDERVSTGDVLQIKKNHRLYDGTTSEITNWNYTTSSYWDVNTSCLIFADSGDSNLALSNFAVSGQNEHVFTLSWKNPSGVEFKSMNYVIYLLTTTVEGESAETTKTSVETGSLEPDATSFTTKSNLQAKSKYSVEITAVTANAWYTSSTDGVEISTTDDITPPNKPNVTLVSNTEDSITLKYIKGDSSDDTATLWFSVSGEGSDKATISASLDSESEPITYSETFGLDVSSIETNAELADVKVGTNQYVLTDLTENASYSLFAYDGAGNVQETGVNAEVKLSTFTASAAPKYTGSILVTWNDIVDYASNGDKITYTYTASGTGPTAITEKDASSGTSGAHFTGLKVSDDKATANLYTFTVNATATNGSTPKTASTQATAAKTVIWKIGNGYSANSGNPTRFLAWGKSSSSTVCYNTGALADSANPTAIYWIVRPALSGADGYFSLEAAADSTSGLGTGYYLYVDTSTRAYVAYSGSWGSGGNGPYVMVASATGMENSGTSYIIDKKTASFKWTSSSYGDSWSKLVSEHDDMFVQHASLTFSAKSSSTTEDSVGCGAFKVSSISYADVDYTKDSPVAPTVGTATAESAISVKLTWTNPTDADFSHVVITCDSNDSISVKSTGTSTTITGLTSGTNYTFKITAYDYYGNASSSASFSQVTTSSGTDKPTDAKVTVGYTGQLIVEWKDANISSDYTYTVSASSSGSDEVPTQTNIAQGTQKAIFNGLTVGNTYTFTVSSILDSTTSSADSTVSATATRQVVYVVNGGGNYLQVKTKGKGAFWTSLSSSYMSKWILMPSLADETDASSFSLQSADDNDYWLVIDTSTTYTKDTADSPVGGFDSNNNKNVLILTTKPTDSDGYKKASFKIIDPVADSATSNSGYSSYLWVNDTSYYLREWWGQAVVHKTSDTGTTNGKYSFAKFIEVTE